MKTSFRGFTLIELLVVIAIIGLLSAIVLASLNTARAKGEDAGVKSEVVELQTLYTEQYSDVQSYDAMKGSGPSSSGGWFQNAAQCNSPAGGFTGTYGSQAEAICAAMMNDEGGAGGSSGNYLYTAGTAVYSPSSFTIMAWLPGAQAWFCVGSSGGTTLSPTAGGTSCTAGAWCGIGCYGNP
jgi:prepilin-type N-terminal cleavage/methylation domain-containing protein